ncbi:MAG: hypothetical protein LKJ47_04630 [Bifidobacteriaceae bacterium]|jgi:hypothetical protein|nr:hypothetical protein [Bifidobacteriaceae bacterium]
MAAGRVSLSRPHGVSTFITAVLFIMVMIELRLVLIAPHDDVAIGSLLQSAPLALLSFLYFWYKATWRVTMDAASPGVLSVTRGFRHRHFSITHDDIARWEMSARGWRLMGGDGTRLLFVPRSARYSDHFEEWLQTNCGAVGGIAGVDGFHDAGVHEAEQAALRHFAPSAQRPVSTKGTRSVPQRTTRNPFNS